MKNLKVVITSLVLVASLALPTSLAQAEGTTNVGKVAKNPAKAEIKAERQVIKTNRDTNQELKAGIKVKNAQIKELTKQAKENNTLKDKQEAVKAQMEIIKSDKAALKAGNVNLKANWGKTKEDKVNKEFDAIVVDLNAIGNLQTEKKLLLEKLSADLDTLIVLFK